jgi:tripartite-type tricarboxylate transporter receptor subunit TctC
MFRNVIRLAAAMTIAATAMVGTSQAFAAWPDHPVTIIVPYAAGGNTDIMARIAAQELQKALGQSFVVENIAGAGGAIATQKVARMAPDGYTLLFATTAQFAIVPRMQKVSYDPVRDFIPIAVFGQSFSVLGINAKIPAKTLAEFIDYAKAHPNEINYGSGGVGTVGHLVSASFANRAGLKMTHVPYKGGSQTVTDLLAGQIQMYFGNSSELLPYYKSNEIRLLAVGTEKRVPDYPDIPAVTEVLPGFSMPAWNGFLAPAGTAPDIVRTLTTKIDAIVHDPTIAANLRKIGIEPGGVSGADFVAYVPKEIENYKTAVDAAGIGMN